MSKVFFDELKMSIKSIVPITVIVLIISAIFFNNDLINLMPAFLIGSFFLTIGMTFFNLYFSYKYYHEMTKICNNYYNEAF